MRWIITFVILVALIGLPLKAQSEVTKADSINQVEQLQDLRLKIEQLQNKIEAKEEKDELQKLMEEAQKFKAVDKKEEHGVGKKFHTGVRQQSGLNPNISASGDFFAGVSSSGADFIAKPSDYCYGNNGFFLREMELSLVAPLDPFTRGKSFISLSENSISIEETYMEWLNLPLNMNLKIGLFNAEFGILNRYHDHALPQFDRPKVLRNFFTNAYLGGFGLAGNFLLKPILGAHASMFDLAIMNGGNGASFTNEGELGLIAVGNFTNFYDVTGNTFFEWRLGAATGYNDAEEQHKSLVGNLAINLKWIPSDRAKYRTFDWKTEFLYSTREEPTGTIKSKGIYSSIQNKLNARWWMTGRIDYSELPYDNNQNEWAFTGGADYWQSEFVFIRFQYQYSQRSFSSVNNLSGSYPNDHSLIIQVNWAMGPHKHEAY